jgi:type II secretory pathway component PulK
MKRAFHSQASALIIVLWALLLLSAATISWMLWVQKGIMAHAIENRSIEARAMAHSGMTLALSPQVTRLTPLPPEELVPGVGYEVRIRGEGGKLNLNWLMRGEEPLKIAMFKQWLQRRGLDLKQTDTLVDCLLDYIDADNVKRLNGAEDDGDYHPANRELQSIEELARVRGTGPLTSQAGWQNELTIYSLGPIDLAAADAEILALLPGIGDARIQRFVQMRAGLDGIDGTADDVLFPTIDAIQQALGLSAAQFEQLRPLVTYQDPTLNIQSIGHSADTTRKVEAVVRKGAGKPQILSWKE